MRNEQKDNDDGVSFTIGSFDHVGKLRRSLVRYNVDQGRFERLHHLTDRLEWLFGLSNKKRASRCQFCLILQQQKKTKKVICLTLSILDQFLM